MCLSSPDSWDLINTVNVAWEVSQSINLIVIIWSLISSSTFVSQKMSSIQSNRKRWDWDYVAQIILFLMPCRASILSPSSCSRWFKSHLELFFFLFSDIPDPLGILKISRHIPYVEQFSHSLEVYWNHPSKILGIN